jgi:deoxyribodipyrimidine photo-lyase
MNPNLTYHEILALVDAVDPKAYVATRNHLNGAVSRLSPYITRGVISLPAIRDRILEKHTAVAAEKFLQELAWREYFQKVYTSKGEGIFSELRFQRSDWRHHEVVTAIASAQTGIVAIDTAIEELYRTGYMHNHARMWTAMLACNVAKAHWYEMSRWLYYHLLDGDVASNTLSWQWVAGVSVQKQYVADQQLINGCTSVVQSATYLDIPREEIGTKPIPDTLTAHAPFSYVMEYPTSDRIENLSGKKVLLYHPWSIDPLWRQEEEGERIFILEPRVFDRFPVSPKVLEHMMTLLKVHVPTAKVFVGNVETLPSITAAEVYAKAHPAMPSVPGAKDLPEELYPQVTGYHQSFFKFWQACQKGS